MFDINNVFTYAYSAGTQADLFQTVTADAESTNRIDLDKANIRLGAGKPMWVIARIGAVDWATIVSLEIILQTDTDTTFTTALKIYKLGRFAVADMVAGALLLNTPLPHMKYQRYMRMYFNVFTSNTAGTIMVALADGPEDAATQIDMVDAGS